MRYRTGKAEDGCSCVLPERCCLAAGQSHVCDMPLWLLFQYNSCRLGSACHPLGTLGACTRMHTQRQPACLAPRQAGGRPLPYQGQVCVINLCSW